MESPCSKGAHVETFGWRREAIEPLAVDHPDAREPRQLDGKLCRECIEFESEGPRLPSWAMRDRAQGKVGRQTATTQEPATFPIASLSRRHWVSTVARMSRCRPGPQPPSWRYPKRGSRSAHSSTRAPASWCPAPRDFTLPARSPNRPTWTWTGRWEDRCRTWAARKVSRCNGVNPQARNTSSRRASGAGSACSSLRASMSFITRRNAPRVLRVACGRAGGPARGYQRLMGPSPSPRLK